MNWKSKKLFTLCSSAFIAVLVFAQPVKPDGTEFCSCSQGIALSTELPMSHPINRCATEHAAEVSWASWFKGESTSTQFHFLDLLELLSRKAEAPSQERSPV